MTSIPQLPCTIGVAADLIFIETNPIAYLTDRLLVYEKAIIPIDPQVVSYLYSRIGVDQIGRLLESKRLAFCPAISLYSKGKQTSVEWFIKNLHENFRPVRTEERKSALEQIEKHLVFQQDADYHGWEGIKEAAIANFISVAKRPGYEYLTYDRQVGLQMGLARINDLICAGVMDHELDDELPALIDISFPGGEFDAGTPRESAKDILSELHQITNLPSPGRVIATENWDDQRAIDLILSDESGDLREWLRENIEPGLDVSATYMRSLSSLPSKKEWIGWLRFGTVTGVSTAVGAILDPLGGALAGAVIGAADYKYGEKVLELADPYHPKKWLSLAGRGYVS